MAVWHPVGRLWPCTSAPYQVHKSKNISLITARHALKLRSLALPGTLLNVPPLDKLMRPQEVVSAARAHQAVAGGGEEPVHRLCCQRRAICSGEHEGMRGCQLSTPAVQPRLELQTTGQVSRDVYCCVLPI